MPYIIDAQDAQPPSPASNVGFQSSPAPDSSDPLSPLLLPSSSSSSGSSSESSSLASASQSPREPVVVSLPLGNDDDLNESIPADITDEINESAVSDKPTTPTVSEEQMIEAGDAVSEATNNWQELPDAEHSPTKRPASSPNRKSNGTSSKRKHFSQWILKLFL